jgi:hypothetical protein
VVGESGGREGIVAKASRKPPSILEVNRESRQEGMKVYIMAKLDHRVYRQQKGWIYYNPEADIIYFRHGTTCLRTLRSIFRTGLTIPRIAIDIDCPKDVYCPFLLRTFSRFRSASGSQTEEEIRVGSTLEILYGSHKGRYLRCKGLRDVFWVETNTLDPEFRTIDESVGLRPLEPVEVETTGRGTEVMDWVKKYAEANKCTGQHHLSKLYLKPASTKVYQRLFLHIGPYIQDLVRDAIKRVSKSSGCEVSLSCAGNSDSGLRLLKFVGRPESVELAMQAYADERARFHEKSKQYSFKLLLGEIGRVGKRRYNYCEEDDDNDEEEYEDYDYGEDGGR